MKDYPDRVLELMDEGREVIVTLMRFEFGTGVYGFIKAEHPTTHDSVEYVPGGAISISDIEQEIGTSAKSFVLELAESPDDGLTPAVLATIENEDYRDRPVYLMDAIFDPETNEQLHVETVARGYVDTIDHERDPVIGAKLRVTCENRALDYSRKNGRQANKSDQAKRNATDTFFDNISTAGIREINWGK